MPDELMQLAAEVKRTNRLLALLLTKGERQKSAIATLKSAGFAPKEIAAILGTTPGTVSVALSNMKRKGSARRPPAPKDA
jgi:DNA-binding CsgD family transcriptional regulator